MNYQYTTNRKQLHQSQRATVPFINHHPFSQVARLAVTLLILTGLLSVPQATYAQSTGIVAVTGTDGARVRDTPEGTVIQILGVGQTVSVTGRTVGSDWLFATLADTGSGWMAADELLIFGSTRLPVVDAVGSSSLDSGADTEASEPTANELSSDPATAPVSSTTESAFNTSSVNEAVTETVIAAASSIDGASLTGVVSLSNSRLNIRSGPATTYAIIGKAQPAQSLTLLGRNVAGDWLQVELETASSTETASAFGWVASRYVETTGDPLSLSVVDTISTTPTYTESGQQTVRQTANTVAVAAQSTVAGSSATTSSVGAVTGNNGATGLTGTLVFQSSPGGMIYAYRLETGTLWSLTNGFDPAISPDGKSVAFVREGGQNGVYLINIDGSNEHAIFTGRTRLSSPKWSPDGNWILFTRSDEYTECVNLGRGGCLDVNALPPNVPTDELEVSKDYEYNLAAVDTNGDHYHDIAALESARVADWNEAGIVYQSSAGLQITADSEDAENRLLLFIPLQPPHEDPDWQPNGGKVAFVQHHGSHYEIYTINSDSSGMIALTRPVTSLVDEMPNNLAPAWSPDGRHIVFLSNRDAGNEAGAWRIWVMDADGSNQRALPINVTINYSYGNEQAVSWGPSAS